MAKITEDMAGFKKDIQYLTQITERGFKEVHKRQDVANGKLLRHEGQIIKLEEQKNGFLTKEDHEKIEVSHLKDKITSKQKAIWYGLGIGGSIASGIIIFIASHIIGGLT